MANTEPNTGYAPVNGMQMYYEIHGNGGTPVVLLHGSFMTIDLNWQELLPALAETRQVIAVEMQAHGHTADIDRPITHEDLADDIAELLRNIGVDQADILGYSLGGGVAVQVLVRHPEVVRKAVIISSPFAKEGWLPDVHAGIEGITAEVLDGTPLGGAYRRVAPDPDRFPILVEKVKAQEAADWGATRNEVEAITAPVMILIGDADGMRLEHAVEMFRLLGGGVFGDFAGVPPSRLAVVPGATHVGLMMRSGDLLSNITPFLDEPMPEGQ